MEKIVNFESYICFDVWKKLIDFLFAVGNIQTKGEKSIFWMSFIEVFMVVHYSIPAAKMLCFVSLLLLVTNFVTGEWIISFYHDIQKLKSL